jgi:hypothetical protein
MQSVTQFLNNDACRDTVSASGTDQDSLSRSSHVAALLEEMRA